MHTTNVTRFVAAIALVVGLAFAVPPASAAEEDETDPAVPASSGPGVCIPFSHEDAPVASDGCVQADLAPDEDPTDRCSVTATEDPELVLVECQLSTSEGEQECVQIYWKYEVGPVTWENRGCDGEIRVDEDWRPPHSIETTQCFHIYWKVQLGPVVWENRGCDGDVYVDEDWRILSETDSSQPCPHVYWKVDAVVVVWEQRSACEGDIETREDRLLP